MLSSLGHDHIVIAPGSVAPFDASDHQPGALPPRRGRVVRIGGRALPYDRSYHLLTRFDRVRALVRSEEPDVIEAHSPYLGAAAAVMAGRRPARALTTFWHSDHIGAWVEPALARWGGGAFARTVATPLRRGLRALLAPFDATFVAGRNQATMLRRVGVAPVFHVPFGVDVSTFHPDAGSAVERRRLLGSQPHAALLVGVGRLSAEKSWGVVLDAFARVRARRDAVLVLFGDGPERRRLEASAPPGVRFEGFVRSRARLAAALANADVMVHGCACETSGLSIVEAVASGLPVVAPDSGGALESTEPACSASYPRGDAVACAAAIDDLLARDPLHVRARARDAARRVPTDVEHVRAVTRVYEDLLRR